MLRYRIIPCLLKKDSSLVKTIRFNETRYIGDAINTIQIFNNLEADEVIVLDITATKDGRKPDFEFITQVTDECFMPFAYGGGIDSIEDMKKIFSMGTEKIIICTKAFENKELIKNAASLFGSQSVIVSVDVKKNIFGKYQVYTHAGTRNTKLDPIRFAKDMEAMGAGEIFLNSIDNDGVMEGFDTNLIEKVSQSIGIPLIASGGAGSRGDLQQAIQAGAAAVAAGSLFVYQNKNRSVLINYPSQKELEEIIKR